MDEVAVQLCDDLRVLAQDRLETDLVARAYDLDILVENVAEGLVDLAERGKLNISDAAHRRLAHLAGERKGQPGIEQRGGLARARAAGDEAQARDGPGGVLDELAELEPESGEEGAADKARAALESLAVRSAALNALDGLMVSAPAWVVSTTSRSTMVRGSP